MKESYKEDLANHFGLLPYTGEGNFARVASARGHPTEASADSIEERNSTKRNAEQTAGNGGHFRDFRFQ